MPMLHIKTFLIMAHLFGLTIGLGGATILDVIFLRLIVQGRAIQSTHARLVALISKLVTWALVMLWLSGIGFLLQYWKDSPELLANPKLYAKVAIVGILTLNGLVLHARVLPIIYQNVGRPLFDDLGSRQQLLMVACGTISMISWYTPFFLGVAREMNFVVPASWILTAYAGLVVAAIGMALLLGPILLRFAVRRREIPGWAFADQAISRPAQAVPPSRSMATAHGDEATIVLVRAFLGEIHQHVAWLRSKETKPEILPTWPLPAGRAPGKAGSGPSSQRAASSRPAARSNDCAA
jgi:hypothetical protein